ncbi:hypothetical protein GGX14DRAFT_532819 [Mycena pura]|uniref:DNA breaking-rejoining enzyme n=1 Tax=Mycena pura TaxID=153505 RepID=A0AAD6VRW7_9AGAR|nr:hypothetical protein GGX14DRAFT_532819 [Mycena pura]
MVRPSPYRPHVPASHRLLAWCTPFGLSQQSSRRHIPPRDQAMAFAEISNGLCKKSLSTYAAGLLRFTQWCDARNIPEHLRMPADPFLLVCFTASVAGSASGACAKNWLNGLAYWHHINLAPWHGDAECVSKALRSVVKKGIKFKRPPRGPVTVEHLRFLRSRLDISSPRGAAFWALALCAFWGCRRLGELTLETLKAFDASHNVSRNTKITRSQQSGREVVSIHLPWTKTTGVRGGTLIITATDDDLCPVRALHNHFSVNVLPDHNTPLFAFRAGADWKPIVKAEFLVFITSVFRDGNLEQVFGHSFRIGGSVHLLCDGVEPEIVMKIGGWSSTCFLIYWRRLETVIPVALVRAWSTRQTSFASSNNLPDDLTSELDVARSR